MEAFNTKYEDNGGLCIISLLKTAIQTVNDQVLGDLNHTIIWTTTPTPYPYILVILKLK